MTRPILFRKFYFLAGTAVAGLVIVELMIWLDSWNTLITTQGGGAWGI